jgi:hypothetical protein
VPTQVSDDPNVQQHYVTQVAVTAALLEQLQALWPTVEPLESAAALAQYLDEAAGITRTFSEASISLSADYYEALRDAQVGGLPYRTDVIPVPDEDYFRAAIARAAREAEAEVEREAALIREATQRKVDEVAQKLAADFGRDQVVASLAGDDAALGFRRIARPEACYFCLSLAIREPLYKTRSTAGQVLSPNTSAQVNRYHYNCQCQVVPVFTREVVLESHLQDAQDLYDRATENSRRGQRLNDFRNALAASRRGEEPPSPLADVPTPTGPSPNEQLAALLGRLAQ